MSTVIDLISASMRADTEGLRLIAQNVANSQSTAYRRQVTVAHASFDHATATSGGEALGAAPSGVATGVAALSSATSVDLTPGTLQSTADPLNLAVDGKGFFVVDTAGGEMLTRRGDFRLDSSGRLVTQAGDPVLGAGGPIKIDGGQPTIAADGTVRVGGDVVDRLRIAEVPDAAALQPTSNGLYALTAGAQSTDVAAPIVRQGFLETANVQTVNEMIRMMETLRRFEASQHFVRAYDDMMDKTITTLGKI